jgi:hypothetical protein
MEATKQTIEAFERITESSLCRIDGPDIDLLAAIVDLCEAVENEDGDNDAWIYVGEDSEFTVPDFLIGAYWALEGWTGDGYHDTNAAYYAIGGIYSPGMVAGPEGSGEEWAYQVVGRYMARPRLEHLRAELRAKRLPYGDCDELEGLAEFIDEDDFELLEAAGELEGEDE